MHRKIGSGLIQLKTGFRSRLNLWVTCPPLMFAYFPSSNLWPPILPLQIFTLILLISMSCLDGIIWRSNLKFSMTALKRQYISKISRASWNVGSISFLANKTKLAKLEINSMDRKSFHCRNLLFFYFIVLSYLRFKVILSLLKQTYRYRLFAGISSWVRQENKGTEHTTFLKMYTHSELSAHFQKILESDDMVQLHCINQAWFESMR